MLRATTHDPLPLGAAQTSAKTLRQLRNRLPGALPASVSATVSVGTKAVARHIG